VQRDAVKREEVPAQAVGEHGPRQGEDEAFGQAEAAVGTRGFPRAEGREGGEVVFVRGGVTVEA